MDNPYLAAFAKQDVRGSSFEVSYGRAWMETRRTLEGWDGTKWVSASGEPRGIVAVMVDILETMDGGTMWEADVIKVNFGVKAASRLLSKGLIMETGWERGKGRKFQTVEPAADEFIMRNTMQGRLF